MTRPYSIAFKQKMIDAGRDTLSSEKRLLAPAHLLGWDSSWESL
jgi:hypothetical protein